MKACGFGRIVNMSSRAALGKELRTAYAATKAGLIGMTRVWALELGQPRDHGQCDRAGPDPSELFDRADRPDSLRTQAIVDSVPVKRVGTPEDVAQAVSFFLDRRSGFTTGQMPTSMSGMDRRRRGHLEATSAGRLPCDDKSLVHKIRCVPEGRMERIDECISFIAGKAAQTVARLARERLARVRDHAGAVWACCRCCGSRTA